MHACMCVCMHACMYTYVCIYVYMYVCMYVRMYVCMCGCMHFVFYVIKALHLIAVMHVQGPVETDMEFQFNVERSHLVHTYYDVTIQNSPNYIDKPMCRQQTYCLGGLPIGIPHF